MYAVLAANLLSGLARDRRVVGSGCGWGRVNGWLARCCYDRRSNRRLRCDAAAQASGVVRFPAAIRTFRGSLPTLRIRTGTAIPLGIGGLGWHEEL